MMRRRQAEQGNEDISLRRVKDYCKVLLSNSFPCKSWGCCLSTDPVFLVLGQGSDYQDTLPFSQYFVEI